jgi:hypothetical protein
MEYKALDKQVLAVAVEGEVGDWSAYIGAVEGRNHEQEFEEVAKHGTKLHRKIAELLFPEWKKLVWRY